MKLNEFEIFPLSIPLSMPVRTSFGVMRTRQACLVELRTDEGITGWGESWINYPSWGLSERVATLSAICESIMGKEFTNPSALTHDLFQSFSVIARQWGAVGPVSQAISAIDLALWDIYGKVMGVPVYKLLDGETNKVRVYGSGIAPEQAELRLRQANERGYEAVKIKIGFGRQEDIKTVKLAKEIWGERPLMLDANQGWSLREAIEMCENLSHFNPYWIEEPIQADDFKGLNTLATYTEIPMAVGENVYGSTFFELISSGIIQYLQPDLAKMGGISKALEIRKLAVEYGSPTVIPHVFGTALSIICAAHFNAATDAPWLELDMNDNPLREQLLIDELPVNDGHIVLSDQPGWGVGINRAKLLEFGSF